MKVKNVVYPKEFHTDQFIDRKKYRKQLKRTTNLGLILTDSIRRDIIINKKSSELNILTKNGIIDKRNQVERDDGMTNITEREFEQFENRINDKLSNIDSKVDKIPESLDQKIELHFEKMKNTQTKWFIGVLIALLGLAGRIFGIY